ncbi:MAG: hypothetical protein DRR16_32605 [Candidatus Parabeggiatoa sp. nov. 3]|nr:MAG: hypothetical protein DRR00_13945 [Gammaproteobacteria bacterium]RKZ66272.1 MAG: hypothetical protein DRQ99_10210 [Gammaproteobacteria bacterium]RKZ73926.1 MAG: hypothetical protein DRR16_32605 [Gammaproteobacteria bacterium]
MKAGGQQKHVSRLKFLRAKTSTSKGALLKMLKDIMRTYLVLSLIKLTQETQKTQRRNISFFSASVAKKRVYFSYFSESETSCI